MNPLTASKDVPEALGRLMDEHPELAAAARDAEESIEAKLAYLREVLDSDHPREAPQLRQCERMFRRIRLLAGTRERAAEARARRPHRTDRPRDLPDERGS